MLTPHGTAPAATRSTVTVRLDEGLAWVEFNRPEVLNAVRVAELTGLAGQLRVLSVRRPEALVLQGGSGGTFCSGFDIKATKDDPEGQASRHSMLQECIAALLDAPFVTLAVIRGYCLGAGLDLSLACDFRIAVGNAAFGMPAAGMGVLYDIRSVRRISGQYGVEAARALFLANRRLSTAEAAGVGLLTDVCADEQELPAVLARWLDSSRKIDGDLVAGYRRQIVAPAAPGEAG